MRGVPRPASRHTRRRHPHLRPGRRAARQAAAAARTGGHLSQWPHALQLDHEPVVHRRGRGGDRPGLGRRRCRLPGAAGSRDAGARAVVGLSARAAAAHVRRRGRHARGHGRPSTRPEPRGRRHAGRWTVPGRRRRARVLSVRQGQRPRRQAGARAAAGRRPPHAADGRLQRRRAGGLRAVSGDAVRLLPHAGHPRGDGDLGIRPGAAGDHAHASRRRAARHGRGRDVQARGEGHRRGPGHARQLHGQAVQQPGGQRISLSRQRDR